MDSQASGAVQAGGRSTSISVRELEVLRLVAEGLSGREAAHRLCRSQRTVESHLRSIYRKLGARNRVEMLRAAAHRGLLGEPVARAPFALEVKGRAFEALREIDERLARAPSADYFGELARALCDTLRVRWAGVTLASPGSERLEMVALAADGVIEEHAGWARSGSPCGATLEFGQVTVLDGIDSQFPSWTLVDAPTVRSYVGVRLDDRLLGAVGTLWVMHDGPMAEDLLAPTILRLLATRTAAELGFARIVGRASGEPGRLLQSPGMGARG